MKLTAIKTPYSSIVGGGLQFFDEKGAVRFMLALMGTTQGITKDQTAAITDALLNGLPPQGFDVPDGPQ